MRNFWKRANRGLLLGGVLVIGVAGYVTIDYIRFMNSRDAIEQTLNDYFTGITQASVTPAEQQSFGYKKTEAQQETYYNNLADVIRAYWTDTFDNSGSYAGCRKSPLLQMAHDVAYDTEYPGYITNYTINLSKLTLSKNGPNAVLFQASASYALDTYGECPYLNLCYYDTVYYDSDSEDNDTEHTFYEGALRTALDLTIHGELLYENGSWKISYMNLYWSGDEWSSTVPLKGGN